MIITNKKKPVIVLLGALNKKSSFSQVNSKIYSGLINAGYSLKNKYPSNPEKDQVDIVIHHDPEEEFPTFTRPNHGKFIAFRTWDFGPYPLRWVEKINNDCDQLWVYSNWNKDQAIAGGVTPELVKVISLGVDPEDFSAKGERYDLPEGDSFRFIFAGSLVYRKGIDILLTAYKQAFSITDKVILVIKENSDQVFYEGITYKEQIKSFQNDSGNPKIHLIDTYLTDSEMAALYRACDVGVFPYRSEGFLRPALELMAVGTPLIVPDFGPCKDYCSNENAFVIPAKRMYFPVKKMFSYNTLGFEEEIEAVDFCEVDPSILAEKMRAIFDAGKGELVSTSKAGIKSVRNQFTWGHTNDRIIESFTELA